jgi:hypothetical protein
MYVYLLVGMDRCTKVRPPPPPPPSSSKQTKHTTNTGEADVGQLLLAGGELQVRRKRRWRFVGRLIGVL